MNWGGFADGFSHGFNNGISMGKTLKDIKKQNLLEDARAEGMASARAQQEQAAIGSVRENGIGSPTQPTAPTTDAPPADGSIKTSPVDVPTQASIGAPDAAPAPQPAPPAPAPAFDAAPKAPELTSTPQAAPAPADPPAAPTEAPKEAPVAAGGIQKRFSVGDKGFDSREEAVAFAKANPPDIMDFISKSMVPKMQQVYLEQGDIEKAEAWGKWAKNRDNEKHMESWGKAFKAYQANDFVGAAKNLVAMHADFPDGNTIVSADPVKDKAGNVTGFNMKVKNENTGETRAQFVDPKTLTEYGLGALSPDKMFEAVHQRQSQADLLGAKARYDEQNDARTERRELRRQEVIENRADKRAEATDRRAAAKDERQHGYKLEELTTADDLRQAGYGKEEKAKLQAKIDVAKESGATPEEIKAIVRHNLGGETYKKTTDPSERRALVRSDLMKNDPTFPRAKPEEQAERINRAMQQIYQDDAKPAAAPPAADSAGKAAPAAAKKGVPYLTPDGKIVYR